MNPPYKRVHVVWRDSAMLKESIHPDDIPEICIMHSVGWLVRERGKDVCVAGEVYSDQEDWLIRHVTNIPRENVVSITELK